MTTYAMPSLFDSAPVDEDTSSLLALIRTDRLHGADVQTVLTAIHRTATDHDGICDPNRLRALLHNEHGCVVYPPVIGSVVSALAKSGVLVLIGYVPTTGSTTGNNGRPAKAYRYHVPVGVPRAGRDRGATHPAGRGSSAPPALAPAT